MVDEIEIRCIVNLFWVEDKIWNDHERPIFRNFEISNIKKTIFLFPNHFSFVQIIRTLEIYDNLPNWKFLEFL